MPRLNKLQRTQTDDVLMLQTVGATKTGRAA
jgi:hypothetical protein